METTRTSNNIEGINELIVVVQDSEDREGEDFTPK